MSDRWRGVLAALLNPELRAALAEMPAVDLIGPRRDRAFARLEQLGLARREGDDWVFDEGAVRGILNENPPEKPVGPARFLDRTGRIDRYPLRDDDRRELLEWVADAVLPRGPVWSEREVNELLDPLAPGGDVAVLRRYLVDLELLERTRSGSEYARTPTSGV